MNWQSKYAMYPDCKFRTGRYVNGNLALQVESPAEGLICVCSVNPDAPLPDDELAVKDWSENEGMVEELKRQNVIFGDPVKTFYTAYGFVKIKVFALTDYGKSLFKAEGRFCRKCGHKLTRRNVTPGYQFYCPNCDEDMYGIEARRR